MARPDPRRADRARHRSRRRRCAGEPRAHAAGRERARPHRPARARRRRPACGGRPQDREEPCQQGRRPAARPIGDVSARDRGRAGCGERTARWWAPCLSGQAGHRRTRPRCVDPRGPARVAAGRTSRRRRDSRPHLPGPSQRRLRPLPGALELPGDGASIMTPRYAPAELADALGLSIPTDEQAAVISAPLGPLAVIAGAGAGKTETMAARVVWLVANGYADPSQVLGLTFTRKAAAQLLRRVRSRLARLAGAGLGDAAPEAGPATVSTYHAFAGTLLRDYGLLLPVEPDTRVLSETELWQLAFRVVCDYPGDLDTDKSPAAVTAMVLRLSSALAEHLVDTAALRNTHIELERLVHTLPAGPYQRDRGPSQWLLRMLAVQHERTQLVPLVDALHAKMRAEKVMDFSQQMSLAARLALAHPEVSEQLRQRFRVVLLDEYQDTGHAQRIALSSLFGAGVDDDLALTAVGDP